MFGCEDAQVCRCAFCGWAGHWHSLLGMNGWGGVGWGGVGWGGVGWGGVGWGGYYNEA